MSRFNNAIFGTDSFGGNPVPSVKDGRVAWIFTDNLGSYELEVNPNEASVPTKKRNFAYQATCAGQQVIYEGRQSPGDFSFSGVILSEEQLTKFEEWFAKRKQIRIADDLDNKYWVYLKSFSPKRVKHREYPFFFEYSASAVTLDRGAF